MCSLRQVHLAEILLPPESMSPHTANAHQITTLAVLNALARPERVTVTFLCTTIHCHVSHTTARAQS
jgi:hypothetical protein